MKIIDRYILKHFVGAFVFCLLVFVLLYIVIDLFDNLNEMIENKVDLRYLLPYYLSFIPLISVQIVPIAVLISIMFSLGTFSRYNEILAMQASGISLLRILRPLIAAGFLISVVVFIINDKVVPMTTIHASEIKEERMVKPKIKAKLGSELEKKLENIAFYGVENKIIYARYYFVYKNMIQELIVHSQDEHQNIASKITARETEWKDNGWRAKDVVSYRLDSSGRIVGEPEYYEEKTLDIKETPADFRKRKHQSEFMSFEFMSYAELNDYIKRLSFESGPTIRNLKVSLNQKIAFPFISLIVILIASPFALIHVRRGGVLLGIVISVGLIFLYYIAMTVSLAMGRAGFLPPPIAAWSTNAIFAFIGLVLIIRHK